MKVAAIILVVALCYGSINAEVSENCLWGREDAASCCKNIPDGDATHLANPKECSSFYICRNNKPMLFPCLPGQIWNVKEQKCTASDTPNKCEQVTALRIAQRAASEDCLWGRESAATCCKKIPNGDPTHLANPKGCSSFYVCRNNKPMLWPCLPGQIWNVKEQKCTASDTPNKCEQVSSLRSSRAKISENCLYGRETAAKCCKSIPNGDATHLANPKECSSFYICRNNKPMLFPCLPGQIWNVKDQKCTDSNNPDTCDQLQ